MKKTILAIVMGLAMAGTASAAELGVNGSYFNSESRYAGGVSLSQSFGPVEGLVGWDRMTEGENQDRYTVAGSVNLFDVGSVGVNVGGGVHYLENSASDNGWAYSVGGGLRLPIDDQVSLVGGVSYQKAIESRVSAFDGVVGTVGVRLAF